MKDSRPSISAMFGINPNYNGTNDKYVRIGDYKINNPASVLPTPDNNATIAAANR